MISWRSRGSNRSWRAIQCASLTGSSPPRARVLPETKRACTSLCRPFCRKGSCCQGNRDRILARADMAGFRNPAQFPWQARCFLIDLGCRIVRQPVTSGVDQPLRSICHGGSSLVPRNKEYNHFMHAIERCYWP